MFGRRPIAAAIAACLCVAGARASTVAQDQASVTASAAVALRELAPTAGVPVGTPGPFPFMPTDTAAYDPSNDLAPGVYLLVPFDGRIAGGAVVVAPVRPTRGGLAPGLLCRQC